jgi:hypothetical protein
MILVIQQQAADRAFVASRHWFLPTSSRTDHPFAVSGVTTEQKIEFGYTLPASKQFYG